MLGEAQSDLAKLDARRTQLVAERDSELERVRTEYASKIAEIDEELTVARRLERALETPDRRRQQAASKPAAKPKPEPMSTAGDWKPSDATLRTILAAMAEGRQTVSDISRSELVTVSRSTITAGMPFLRKDGLIRLAGQAKSGNANARAFRLTPEGKKMVELSQSGNGSHA